MNKFFWCERNFGKNEQFLGWNKNKFGKVLKTSLFFVLYCFLFLFICLFIYYFLFFIFYFFSLFPFFFLFSYCCFFFVVFLFCCFSFKVCLHKDLGKTFMITIFGRSYQDKFFYKSFLKNFFWQRKRFLFYNSIIGLSIFSLPHKKRCQKIKCNNKCIKKKNF
jgi:hypothetical protein